MIKKGLPLMILVLLCAILCVSCGPPVTDIDVGCDASDLIDAVNTANNSLTVTTTLHLSPNCVYEFSEIETNDKSDYPAGVALPEIISPIIIDGQSATIKRASSAETPEFRLLLIGGHGNVTITQLTLENGNVLSSAGLGGAILNYGTLSISESDISENSADQGGGIYTKGTFETLNSVYHNNYAENAGGAIVNKKSMTIISSNFYSNHSSLFGGAVANYGADAQITDCEFNGNITPLNDTTFSMGGAIHNSSYGLTGNDTCSLTISSSIFSNNQAYMGGAVSNRTDSDLHIDESTFINNRGIDGGALFNDSFTGLTNSTLSNNKAEHQGGAVYSVAPFESYGMQIHNCTISGNVLLDQSTVRAAGISTFGRLQIFYTTIAENTGGVGLYIGPDYAGVENSIIADNSGGDCGVFGAESKIITANQANLHSDNTCKGFTIWADPMLEPLANNGGSTLTHKPQIGSPAIDAATDLTETEDQIHQSRPVGSANDLGSFELQPEFIIVPTLVVKPQITPVYVEEPPQKPKFGWDWQFEGFVCSDMGLTEFYMKTSAPKEEFKLKMNDKKVECYQQTYDNERYWCYVEKQPLGWEVPVEVTFCVGEECTGIARTTLSENRCASPDAPSQPQNDACSNFTDERNCIAAPNCFWNCTRTALGESCQCE